ncbi:RNA polymerase sigma factor [Mycobacterium montefiorense]|nr:RNA polymerase sigma factor [Mycobacterium montefiorense]
MRRPLCRCWQQWVYDFQPTSRTTRLFLTFHDAPTSSNQEQEDIAKVNAEQDVKPPFEAVVAHHGATVLRVVRAVVGHNDADDAWSDTFLAALRAYPQLPAGANVEAWLVTIAHRKAIDITRAASRRAVPVADTPDSPARERADGHDLDLDAAVGALPPKQRQAVAYHYLAGLPYSEIATILDSNAAAARRAAADGIATLRRTYPLLDIAKERP